MTTVSELKAMLREEIAEPLDYPRVPGLSAAELAGYNEGYRQSCEIVMKDADAVSPEVFVRARIKILELFVTRYQDTQGAWNRGKGDAYTWILGELKSIDNEPEPDGTITIPRARYNHLLDMEKSVIEFTENFTRWEES